MLTLRTLSARRYRVQGTLPGLDDDAFLRRLHERRFLPLTPNEERTYGWVRADNLLLTEFERAAVVTGRRAAFALRIDRRRPDARLLRARLDLELRGRRRAAEDAGQPFRLSRDERRQLRTDLAAELLRQTSPTIEVHAVLLDARSRTLLAFTLARRPNEVLRALFRDTFGADLEPLTPWRRGAEILAGTPLADRLEEIQRTDFAPSAAAGVDRVLDRAASRPLVPEVPR